MNIRQARNTLKMIDSRRRMMRKRLAATERYLYSARHAPDSAEGVARLEREVADRKAELEPFERAHKELSDEIRRVELNTGITVDTNIIKLSIKEIKR